MATQKSGHRPAGGLHSRNVRHSTAPKSEPKAYGRNPAAVAQYGAHVGDHATTLGGKDSRYRGESDARTKGYNAPKGPSNMALSGPGAGREIYKTGTQCQTGSVNPGKPGLPSTKGQWPD